ncbi:MAG: helix-turn-helix domain-containing protein [Deltaproteobacteria bacterium]|nr:helix-turn-helix domain-containing protein [Deltaproteobacteria bacterium]
MSTNLLTSREVAEFLGVGVSSVNRWADAGKLEHVKTPGGHRRFARLAVEAFRRERAGLPTDDGESFCAGWTERLLGDAPPEALVGQLLRERAERESWLAVAGALGPVLARIGSLWEEGTISVTEEHLASERLARALSRCAELLPVAVAAPEALLAAPESEEHTLGLSLLEPALREWGWHCRFAGRRTPLEDLAGRVRGGSFELVALSASVSTPAAVLGEVARVIGEAAAEAGAALLIGGLGPWPEQLRHGRRVQRFAELERAPEGLRRN